METSEYPLRSEELEEWFNQTLGRGRRRHGGRRGYDDEPFDPDFNDRLYRCWRLQKCGSCLSSDARCGWCPYSSTCIPLPAASDIPLRWPPFAPLNHAHVCPLAPERFELRTRSFGRESCDVSTTTLLTAGASFACGVAAVFVVLGVAWLVARLVRAGRRAKNGLEVLVVGNGNGGAGLAGEGWREERVWMRRSRRRGGNWRWRRESVVEGFDDGDDENGGGDGERQPLLGGGRA